MCLRRKEGSKKFSEAPELTRAGTGRAREEDVYGKGQVARGGEGEALREGEGEWTHAAQPGPYWLGREFRG